jgi:hypothetical protein
LCGDLVIAHLHNVVEVAFRLIQTYLKHVDKAFMQPRHRLKFSNTPEFPLKWPVAIEGIPKNDLYGAVRAHGIARQPHLTVAALPDAPNKLMLRDGNLGGEFGLGRWPGFFPAKAITGVRLIHVIESTVTPLNWQLVVAANAFYRKPGLGSFPMKLKISRFVKWARRSAHSADMLNQRWGVIQNRSPEFACQPRDLYVLHSFYAVPARKNVTEGFVCNEESLAAED